MSIENPATVAAGPEASSGTSAPVNPPPVSEKQRLPRIAPKQVRLAITRIDPWSVMKLSFLLSFAFGIIMIIVAFVFWTALNQLHVFTTVDNLVKDLFGDVTQVNILQFVERDRVMSIAMILSVLSVVVLTALATLAAFLYNIIAALIGGVHLTLTDD